MKKDYNKAYQDFRNSIRDAILSGELPITAQPYQDIEDTFYFADVSFVIGNVTLTMAVGKSICYHNDLIDGIFEGKYSEKFKELVKSKIKVLTPQEKARIKELEDEITKIKGQ